MSQRTVYTFPLLHDYARSRPWLFFLAVIAVLIMIPCALRQDFITAGACVAFAAAAIYYAIVIGGARRAPARIAALEDVIGAQLWFWRITCVATLAVLVAHLLLLGPPA
jgi:hypothetical protein